MTTRSELVDEVNELRGILRDALPYLRNSITYSPVESDRVNMAALCETITAHCYTVKPRKRVLNDSTTRARRETIE